MDNNRFRQELPTLLSGGPPACCQGLLGLLEMSGLTMASMCCAAEAQELLTFEELWLRYSKEEWGCLESSEGPLQGCYVGELQKSDFLGKNIP
ncbi:Zinc finger protein 197 [Manis javanica]|nr:Zinc finger protein 197 [Manis javanica]